MTFIDDLLAQGRPNRIRDVRLPDQPQDYYPSPRDWRDEVLYFLLPDRFSDGQEHPRPLLDRSDLWRTRPSLPDGMPWKWDAWATSGAFR